MEENTDYTNRGSSELKRKLVEFMDKNFELTVNWSTPRKDRITFTLFHSTLCSDFIRDLSEYQGMNPCETLTWIDRRGLAACRELGFDPVIHMQNFIHMQDIDSYLPRINSELCDKIRVYDQSHQKSFKDYVINEILRTA